MAWRMQMSHLPHFISTINWKSVNFSPFCECLPIKFLFGLCTILKYMVYPIVVSGLAYYMQCHPRRVGPPLKCDNRDKELSLFFPIFFLYFLSLSQIFFQTPLNHSVTSKTPSQLTRAEEHFYRSWRHLLSLFNNNRMFMYKRAFFMCDFTAR